MSMKIASLDAADLFTVDNGEVVRKNISLHYVDKEGNVHKGWDRYKFKNIIDDSRMETRFIKVLETRKEKSTSIFNLSGHRATQQIINLTFKYCVKDENKKKVKGYGQQGLRTLIYTEGFTIDDIHYVRWMRSSGSARVGKCLFINEELLHAMNMYSDCGIKLDNGGKFHDQPKEIDLASFEAYRSLLLSSNIDTITIRPENILVIDEFNSEFEDEIIVTEKNENDKLTVQQRKTIISNNIWDGQSLIDKSLMGKYEDKGMLLLRNKMFKSCCFNTNIQQWFADNNITDVSQLNGTCVTKDIKDIKLITTKSSIKYAKFGGDKWFEQWLKKIDKEFGIVKYEKPTKHFAGDKVLTHYQLINTLNLTEQEVDNLLENSTGYMKQLCEDPDTMYNFCSNYIKDETDYKIITKMNILYAFMSMNNDFSKTHYYAKLAKKIIENVRDGIKRGKLFVDGNYSTLLGNPIEMLQQSIGTFTGESLIGVGNVISTRFSEKRLLACRSPHVCMGNIYLPYCKNDIQLGDHKLTDYINLSNEIICINSIQENTLQRLSGCDFDSDTALITDNDILIEAAERNYDKFLVPTSNVEAEKKNKLYTPENLADLDYKTSVNLIGEIINYSQILNSLYWDMFSQGNTGLLEDIYKDICKLSIMSGIEIDKAKKDFGALDQRKELMTIKNKYRTEPYNINCKPKFFEYLNKKSGYKNKSEYVSYNTSMDYLYKKIKDVRFAVKNEDLPLKKIINKVTYQSAKVNMDMANELLNICNERYAANLAMKYMTQEEKLEANNIAYENLVNNMAAVKGINGIGKATLRYILDIVEEQDSAIEDYMVTGLLNCGCKKVIEVFKQN